MQGAIKGMEGTAKRRGETMKRNQGSIKGQ
jgi:hypothetical protein